MQSVRPALDPEPGPRVAFTKDSIGRWHVDGRSSRIPAEIRTNGDGTRVVEFIDSKTGEVIAESKVLVDG